MASIVGAAANRGGQTEWSERDVGEMVGTAAGWPVRDTAETAAILTAPGAPFEMEQIEVLGREVRSYLRMPSSLRAIFDGSRDHGDRTYLAYEDERLGFEAHWRAATAFGRALGDRYGVRKGDRVAIAMRNYPEWSVCAWGALAIGAILVPLNAWEGGELLAALLADAGARVAVVDEERLARLHEAAAVPLIAVRTADPGRAIPLEDLIGAPSTYPALPETPLADPGLMPDDFATIFYTSGTTGRPKGALGTHRNVLTNLVNTTVRPIRAAVRRGDPIPLPPPPTQRRLLMPLPLFHVTGFHSTLVPAMANGSCIHLMRKWDVTRALDLIERARITGLTLVPALAWQLADALAERPRDVTSVDTVGYGGASAAPELAQRMRACFPDAMPGQGYGATETSSLVAANSHEDMLARPGSVGLAVPCCDIRIVDADGHALPPGTPGEIWVSGPNVVQGYWNLPEATEEAFAGGWYRTGDIGLRDDDGFLFILDRRKDMLIRGGENIYCVEIEDCLAAHPAVLEAAVFGIPDRILGERVGAMVRTRADEPADAATLQAHVRARMAAHKVPDAIGIARAPLPRNAAGKLLKRNIRADFLARRTASGEQA